MKTNMNVLPTIVFRFFLRKHSFAQSSTLFILVSSFGFILLVDVLMNIQIHVFVTLLWQKINGFWPLMGFLMHLSCVWGFPVGELFNVYISVYHFNNIIIMYIVTMHNTHLNENKTFPPLLLIWYLLQVKLHGEGSFSVLFWITASVKWLTVTVMYTSVDNLLSV